MFFSVFDKKTGDELLDKDYIYMVSREGHLIRLNGDKWEYSENIMIPVSALDTEKAIFKLYSEGEIVKRINIFEYEEFFIVNEFTSENKNGKWYLVKNIDKFLKEKQKEYKMQAR